jgi:acetyl-CoA carboxylase beta subunit
MTNSGSNPKRNFFGPKLPKETSVRKRVTCQYCKQVFLGDELHQSKQACEYCWIRNSGNKKRLSLKDKTKIWKVNQHSKKLLTNQVEKDKEKLSQFEEKKRLLLEKEQRFISRLLELKDK